MPPSKSLRQTDAPLAGARVMVVDDHSFTISLVKDVLYACGAGEVHTALDGGEAIAMLRGCQPQLVVTDWRMPGLDGLAFTRLIRRAAVAPDPRIPDPEIPIVLLSAHTSARTVETARRAGVNEVVVKPFTITALIQRLQVAITGPRRFVVCADYVGPDRRRRAETGGGPGKARRMSDAAPADPWAHGVSDAVLKQLQAEVDALERPRRLRAGSR